MSERKVLNKYYPPDFDPTKIPRVRQSKNRQFTVRLMAPCNMRCNTCGEYIYKGKKFNARKEDVENESYLGIRIYRFYIKCTRCLAEISFKTDPQSTDYIIEAGATRNFMALKLAEEQAEREELAEKEDEATNPMKLLEKRTQASRHEMAVLEALEELKELNQRLVTPDYETMLDKYDDIRQEVIKTQEEEDEYYIKSVFGSKGGIVKRIEESDSSDDEQPPKKILAVGIDKPTDILTKDTKADCKNPVTVHRKFPLGKETSVGLMNINKKSLVVVKSKSAISQAAPSTSTSSTTTSSKSVAVEASCKGENKMPNSLSLLGGYGTDSSSGSE